MTKDDDSGGPAVTHPTVRLPRSGLPGAAIAGIAIIAALILFLFLDARRRDRVMTPRPSSSGMGFVAPPPLSVPPEPIERRVPEVVRREPPPVAFFPPPPIRSTPPYTVMPQAPVIVPTAPNPAAELPARVERNERTVASPIVIDTEPGTGLSVATAATGQSPSAQGRQPGAGGDGGTARATALANRSDTVPIGTMIPIVLETPIDTARPGLVRAVASGDTRGFDGRRILIPRGSRLIGEYQADVRSGQKRVLVNWTRLIRPDGVMIQLASPAADSLGGAGVPGRVHSFFLERFAGALLQSALTVGVNLASRPRAGSVIVGLPTGSITTVGQGLLPANDLRPKITVKQGAVLNVFVARDLDFSAPDAGNGR